MNCPKCDADISESYQGDEPDVGITGGWYCDACDLAVGEDEREPREDDVPMMSAREFRGDRPFGTPLSELSSQPGDPNNPDDPRHAGYAEWKRICRSYGHDRDKASARGCDVTTEKAEPDTLLPCPFCGGKPTLRRFAIAKDEITKIPIYMTHIECESDGCCEVTVDIKHINEALAVKAWNTRAATPRCGAQREREAIAKIVCWPDGCILSDTSRGCIATHPEFPDFLKTADKIRALSEIKPAQGDSMTTEKAEPDTLLPCPFCGSNAEFERRGSSRQSCIIACTDCGCRLETGETFRQGAQWNTRAAPPRCDAQSERAATIEECAKVAECHSPYLFNPESMRAGIAKAIRALSETKPAQGDAK